MGRLYYMIVFSVLIKIMILVCYFLVITYLEFGRPIFLEGIFGLTLVQLIYHSNLHLMRLPILQEILTNQLNKGRNIEHNEVMKIDVILFKSTYQLNIELKMKSKRLVL
jgi:hypothetical protein